MFLFPPKFSCFLVLEYFFLFGDKLNILILQFTLLFFPISYSMKLYLLNLNRLIVVTCFFFFSWKYYYISKMTCSQGVLSLPVYFLVTSFAIQNFLFVEFYLFILDLYSHIQDGQLPIMYKLTVLASILENFELCFSIVFDCNFQIVYYFMSGNSLWLDCILETYTPVS